ncbi:MAG: DUF86 domain-containing protein [Natronospirillum sp.]|uniref:type VII toxin-antitoxin system HepT family RNase toxin n=1 Tax=Natronospirillum sp. TaxID=2812955 RepID=UPI0025FA83A7|nr:DUF86 domain-containing protein [Natronospirillum sp.]MCH8552267.1 DUF86 domain-containing protein [Natronospirillum sp.]
MEQKLEALRRCIQRVENRLPESLQALQNDLDAQDIVALNLTRAVQLCVDMAAHWLAENADGNAPRTMGQSFDALAQAGIIDQSLASRMKKSVGFRNVMVHSYDEIDWAIVYDIARNHLDDFSAFARVFV